MNGKAILGLVGLGALAALVASGSKGKPKPGVAIFVSTEQDAIDAYEKYGLPMVAVYPCAESVPVGFEDAIEKWAALHKDVVVLYTLPNQPIAQAMSVRLACEENPFTDYGVEVLIRNDLVWVTATNNFLTGLDEAYAAVLENK